MHLISELSDHLNAFSNQRNNKQMVSKKDISMLESLLFLQAIDQCSGKRMASEAFSISIDTISKYIENLEEDLGVKLISSSGKGSNLTSVAQRIVEKASKIKEILDDISAIKLENKEIKGEVRVFISLGYASYMVPHELSALFDIFPDLKINSISATDSSQLNMRDVDIILSSEPIDSFDIVEITNKTVYCGFFASPNYLSEHGYPVDLDDLVKNHRLVHKHNNMLKHAIGEEKLKQAHICFQTNNNLALINAIENSTGIGIMPLSFASQGLVSLDNIPCDNSLCYYLYVNRYTKDIPRVRTLINFYKNIIDRMENPIPTLNNENLPIIEILSGK